MNDVCAEILTEVREMRRFLEAIAEPAIAQRDKKLRDELRRIVGKPGQKSKCVPLLDGTRTQAEIRKAVGISSGNLSDFVKDLRTANLVSGDGNPKLSICVPSNFFEGVTDE